MTTNIISADIQQALSSMGIAHRYSKFDYARLYISIDKLDAAFSALDAADKSSNAPGRLPLTRREKLDGEDFDQVLADMESEWSAYCAEHMWDQI